MVDPGGAKPFTVMRAMLMDKAAAIAVRMLSLVEATVSGSPASNAFTKDRLPDNSKTPVTAGEVGTGTVVAVETVVAATVVAGVVGGAVTTAIVEDPNA